MNNTLKTFIAASMIAISATAAPALFAATQSNSTNSSGQMDRMMQGKSQMDGRMNMMGKSNMMPMMQMMTEMNQMMANCNGMMERMNTEHPKAKVAPKKS